MKIQAAILTVAIVIIVITSVTTLSTFSFAARTNNSTGTQHPATGTSGTQHPQTHRTTSQSTTTSTANIVPSQTTTTTNPVAHNATTTLMGIGKSPGSYPGSYTCSGTDDFLWNHVYGASGNGKEPWNRPTSRLTELKPSCVKVTGTVYSDKGTVDMPDGDLHFTLTLDKNYAMYSKNDPACDKTNTHCTDSLCTSPGGTCKNIIVEVICHTTPAQKYTTHWGDYCNGVHSEYPKGQFPKQGDRLTVSGKFVFDTGTEKWNEIHLLATLNRFHKDT